MPTTATNTFDYSILKPMYEPEEEAMIQVNLPASSSFLKGAILGELAATLGTAAGYLSTNSDGSQIAKYIMPQPCSTDASGNITVGSTTAGGGLYGVTYKTIGVYYRGTFKTSELQQTGTTGKVDANAITNMNGHLISGTVADGVVHIG